MTQPDFQTVHPATLALLQTVITEQYPGTQGAVFSDTGYVTHLLVNGQHVLLPEETEDDDRERAPNTTERMTELLEDELQMNRPETNEPAQVIVWPQETLPLPGIPAEAHDDAHTLSVKFDAAPYFATLSDRRLATFLEQHFNDDEHTDDIAITLAETNPDLATFFDRKPDRYGYGNETNGFNCSYETWPLACFAYLSRPHLRGLLARALRGEDLSAEIEALSGAELPEAEGNTVHAVHMTVYARTAEELNLFVSELRARCELRQDLVVDADEQRRQVLGGTSGTALQRLALQRLALQN